MSGIVVYPGPKEETFHRAKAGAIRVICLHGCGWPPELRANPPRIRLLENARGIGQPVRCEILDPWPGAPAYWPQYREPGTSRPLWDCSGGAPVTAEAARANSNR